ncbi:hypothetical protein HN832_00785 [archaeon]|jgi:hypothetical protein|nr:hypothetical protein [archaeon]MBT4373842.1 hypothetical protein [archaeon]MBT4532364.1 hypothetical protein [archaeon]MBT7001745.1 hypothetical protein [archaeon]MBT7281930.1 hypothetical protein [archaeon]
MVVKNLYLVKHSQGSSFEGGDKKIDCESLCFRSPDFFHPSFVGTAGIWDAEYWIRDCKKNEGSSLAPKGFRYMTVAKINQEDVDFMEGNLIQLNCDLLDRFREALKTNNSIGANRQDQLAAVWGFVENVCREEGFDWRTSNWEDYKGWRDSKIEEYGGHK